MMKKFKMVLRKLDFGSFLFLWKVVFRPHLKQVSIILTLMLLVSFLEAATLGLGVPLLDASDQSSKEMRDQVTAIVVSCLRYFGFSTDQGHIMFSLLLIMGVSVLIRGVGYVVQQYGIEVMAQRIRSSTKAQLFSRLVNAQYSQLIKSSRGALLYDINNPSQAINIIIIHFSRWIAAIFNSIMLVGLMLFLSWWGTLWMGMLLVVWVVGWKRFINPRSAQYGSEIYELNRQMGKIDVDAIDGIRVVKASGIESKVVEVQKKLLDLELRPKTRLVLLRDLMSFLNEFAGAIVIVALGAASLIFGWINLPFSNFVVLIVAVRRIAPALALINSSQSLISRERRSVEVIEKIMNKLPLERSGSKVIDNVDNIQLSDVSFHYDVKPDAPVLDNINFSLKKGTITAIVGPTGSGKSTIVNLLMRFYEPISGRICVNGVDLCDLDLAKWRQEVGYVPQDVFLFNDTIRNNIACIDGVEDLEVIAAAKSSQLHDFVVSLPAGYNTIVGDRGVKLSGGQAQRIAIARAILKRPKILIFDEATSALDNLTEKAVYGAIQSFRGNAIVLVIAHRLSTIKDADQIIVLQKGVVENGTHEFLMELGGMYAQLYNNTAVLETGQISGPKTTLS